MDSCTLVLLQGPSFNLANSLKISNLILLKVGDIGRYVD